MNTCKTCRHWHYYDPADPGREAWDCEPDDLDTGAPMQFEFKVLPCSHPAKTFCERPVERNGFGTVDGSEYYAALITAEDFGCVRWEAK